MELFTFEGYPSEDGKLTFTIVPSADLKKEISYEKLCTLCEDVTDAFVTVMRTDTDSGEMIGERMYKFLVRASSEGFSVSEDMYPALEEAVNRLSDEGTAKFRAELDSFLTALRDMIGEHLEKVFRLK